MAKINSFNFGFIVVDGKQCVYDVQILPDGTVKERQPGKGRLGSHSITSSEIENLLKTQPEVIIIGTGASGLARLAEDAEFYLQQQTDVNSVILPSRQAIDKFNQLTAEGKRVAALFHITC